MNNDITYIKQLLELYYKGLSTDEQERELACFFEQTGSTVPSELEADRELFLAMAEAKVPADLEQSIADVIDRQAVLKVTKVSPLRRWVRMAAAVAVAGVLVGGVVAYIHHSSSVAFHNADVAEMDNYAHITGDMLSPEQVGSQAVAAIDLLSRTLSYAKIEKN